MFVRQSLPSAPRHSGLLSWLSIRPTSEQRCVRSVKIDYPLYYTANLNIAWMHPSTPSARSHISISMRGKGRRKHLHRTASIHIKSSFHLGVFSTELLWGKQAAVSITDFFLKWEIFQDKKNSQGRAQSVQVCSRQHHFLPRCEKGATATYSDLLVFTFPGQYALHF